MIEKHGEGGMERLEFEVHNIIWTSQKQEKNAKLWKEQDILLLTTSPQCEKHHLSEISKPAS